MSKKVFIVSSSPRAKSNSDALAEEFARGARESGHAVEKVKIKETDLKFCIGCMTCQTTGECVLKDGMNSLYDAVQHSDVLVFATPVYYYSVSGQLKTFLDRLNPLYPKENNFKEVYLLATAADDNQAAMDGSVKAVQGFVDCFDGVKLSGVVKGLGVDKVGDIVGNVALSEAFNMGKNI